MLAAFGFETMGVVVGDMFFVDPTPDEGQETPERGVRLELRVVDRGEPQGSIYAGVPIAFTRPVWRVDLFESTKSPPGTLDRVHHHPRFTRLGAQQPELRPRTVGRSGFLAGQ